MNNLLVKLKGQKEEIYMVDTVNANSLKRCRNKKKMKKLEQACKILGK